MIVIGVISELDNFQLTLGQRTNIGMDRQYARELISPGNELLECKEIENQVLDHPSQFLRYGNYSGPIRTLTVRYQFITYKWNHMVIIFIDRACWTIPPMQIYFWKETQTGSFCLLFHLYCFKINLE